MKKIDLKDIKFSDDFYKLDDVMIKFRKNDYKKKLDDFNTFYNKYKPDGFRIVNGKDVYKESKKVFNDVLKGNICVDRVFTNPNNPLRDIVMLMQFDEPYLKKLKNN